MNEKQILQEGVHQVTEAWERQQWESIPSIVSGWSSLLNSQSMMTHVLAYSDAPTLKFGYLYAKSPTRVGEATLEDAGPVQPLKIVLRPAISLTERPDPAKIESILLGHSVALDRMFSNIVHEGVKPSLIYKPTRGTMAFVGHRVSRGWGVDLSRVIREPARNPESRVLLDDEVILANMGSGPLGSYYLSPSRVALPPGFDPDKFQAVNIIRDDHIGGPFTKDMPDRLEFSLLTEASVVISHKKQFSLMQNCLTEESDA